MLSNNEKHHVHRGFSLVELMIVIALIALMCSMGVWLRSGIYRITARMELETLHSTLLYLRSRALSHATDCKLTFDLTKNGYRFDTVEYTLADSVRFGCDPSLHGPPGAATHPITNACTFKNATVKVSAQGIATVGSIYLTDTHNGKVYALTNAVSPYSFFRKYEYDNGWHLLE